MTTLIKKLFGRKSRKIYTLNDTFGCTEKVPQECPTFIERNVHRLFCNNVQSYNINVVYGESRQGKTWMVDRYCPHQLRIGCHAGMDLNDIKVQMLNVCGIQIRRVNHSITENSTKEVSSFSEVGGEVAIAAGLSGKSMAGHSETISTIYDTVDIENQSEFLQKVKAASLGKVFVFDNFHYLETRVQQAFCSLLKEFNYQEIKIIIIGVWKDASRITALASDLVNRCGHVDIGAWSVEELQYVFDCGTQALNVTIPEDIAKLYIDCCAQNIGIFKDIMQKFCQKCGVYETQTTHRQLNDESCREYALAEVIEEAIIPLHDRIINLAMPQREKKDSKHIRLKIIIAILRIVAADRSSYSARGIEVNRIHEEVNHLCSKAGEEPVGISNLTQELGMLHLREENKQTKSNFIPLFFFDRANKKLLIIEPTLYLVKNYSVDMLEEITDELIARLSSYDFVPTAE